MRSKIIAVLTIVLVLAFSSVVFCLEEGDDFVDVQFTTLDNKKIQGSDFLSEDHYTIFDIWATW